MDRLRPLPSTFAGTAASLHRVAERIVSPARKPPELISLQPAPGGFGTPEFEHDGVRQRVRVEGTELVYEREGERDRAPLTTLATAGALVAELLPIETELDDIPLEIDATAARALAELYAFGASLLEQLIAGAAAEDTATPVKLFPEHFDIATELGGEANGARATYGLSPGDEQHPEPYAYVGPWNGEVSGDLWQARGFRGAELTYAELLAATDQQAAAMEFFTTRKHALGGSDR